MSRTDVFRTASFRLAIGSSVILAGASLLQFALIGWRTEHFEHARIDRIIETELASLFRAGARHGATLAPTLRAIPIVGLFAPDGAALEGDVAVFPPALPLDGRARQVELTLAGGRPREITAAARRLPDGKRLLIGRDLSEVAELDRIERHALLLSFLPGLAISLTGGAWLGRRALIRIGDMHRTIERIVAGGLHERLPSNDEADDLERLAGSVNRMLDRIEHLIGEIRGVTDDIAHDLRTPLARVRATLERARDREADELRAGIDKAIADLDRTFVIITALLRIAEIEGRARRAGFGSADLGEIASDACELYQPVAEARAIGLALRLERPATIDGDRDLLMEAVANLLDNAIKFTPSGGQVEIAVLGHVIAVIDDGIGIDASERDEMVNRFHRADRSRHLPGSGLGLSLVSAIAALHDADLTLDARTQGTSVCLTFPEGHRP